MSKHPEKRTAPAAVPALPDVVHEDDVLAAGEALIWAQAGRKAIVVKVCDANPQKRAIASVISQCVVGATQCAQVPLKEVPIGCQPTANGNLYSVRVKLSPEDQNIRDSCAAVIMGVLATAFDLYSYRVRVGRASDVAPS
jgi:hypothetical protein